MTSPLGIKPEDIIPGPPYEFGSPEQQLAELRDWASKMSNALMDFLNLLDGDSSIGLSAADDIINEINANGTVDVSYISINSNGTLTNAGSGQVTIAGLGYTGDLNATNGADWVSSLTSVPGRFGDSHEAYTGLIMTSSFMGYINSGTPTVYIDSSGNFLFQCDANNKVEFVGGTFTVNAQAGFIGSSTDYFDITNSKIQLADTVNTKYLWLEDGQWSIRAAVDGGGPALIGARYDTSVQSAKLHLMAVGTDEARLTFIDGGGVERGYLRVIGTAATLDGFAIQNCTIAASQISSGSIATARMQTNVVAAINAGSGDIATARMQTNAIAAVNASSGTIDVDHGGLDLSSYTTGDLVYASASTTFSKLGIGTAGQILQVNSGATAPEWTTGPSFEHGSYTGDGAAPSWETKYTFGFSPTACIVQRETSTGSPVLVLTANGSAAAFAINMTAGSDLSSDVRLNGTTLQVNSGNAHVNASADYHCIAWK